MEYNVKQITVDELFKKYVPGPDIPKKHHKSLHYVDDASSLEAKWRLNTQIVRLIHLRLTTYLRPLYA